ncbi:DUF1629 domain-containing protein [Acetivibrio clariflavus]|uniref:imm11 family protein n=1 Tax=Acetivibrio clariflavus TaxID=288965 RepID=UPI0031F5A805
MGQEITKDLPIIRYIADSNLEPEDYPFTESLSLFLVSDRIVKILKELEIPGMQCFKSEIVCTDGKVKDNYYTINVINYEDCLNKEKSEFETFKIGNHIMYDFKKIYFDFNKISPQNKVFHIKESVLTFVHQSVKDEFERAGITGVEFKPVYGA